MQTFFNDEEKVIISLLKNQDDAKKIEILNASIENENEKINRMTLEEFFLKVKKDFRRI